VTPLSWRIPPFASATTTVTEPNEPVVATLVAPTPSLV
jgi:hypothetical protein